MMNQLKQNAGKPAIGVVWITRDNRGCRLGDNKRNQASPEVIEGCIGGRQRSRPSAEARWHRISKFSEGVVQSNALVIDEWLSERSLTLPMRSSDVCRLRWSG
jgi:hypothetical protein